MMKLSLLIITIGLLALLPSGSNAELTSNCTQLSTFVSSCEDFVSINSATRPSKKCCAAVRKLVDAKPMCPCDIHIMDVKGIDEGRLASLPVLCKAKNSSLGICGDEKLSEIITSALVASPAASPVATSSCPPQATMFCSALVLVVSFALVLFAF